MSEVKKVERKRGLGRGFDSLIPTDLVDKEFDISGKLVDDEGHRVSEETMREVDPALIDPNPHQPRTTFNPEAIEALAASIRVHGILQPLVATKVGSRYELIAGERRLRAAKIAGLQTVPVVVRSFDEQQKLELALIENLVREDLNLLEIATAYRKLVDEFGMTVTDLGTRVGRDVSTVSNTMRLLNLPLEAKHALVEGRITEGHARVVLSIEEPQKQLEILDLMQRNGWTVRESEEYARGYRGRRGTQAKAQARIASINQLTMDLGSYLGAKVSQQSMAKGGRLVIRYESEADLQRIYQSIQAAASKERA